MSQELAVQISTDIPALQPSPRVTLEKIPKVVAELARRHYSGQGARPVTARPFHEQSLSALSGRNQALHHSDDTRPIELLLARGASVNVRDDHGETPLLIAVGRGSPAIITLLLRRGADVRAKDPWGMTPLMRAAPHPEAVKLLLAHGADVRVRDTRGKTALDWALTAKNAESAELLKVAAEKKSRGQQRRRPSARPDPE